MFTNLMRTYFFGALLSLCLAAVATAAEPRVGATAAAASPLWKIVTVPCGESWEAIRINTATGQAWMAANGSWKPFPELGDSPERGEPATYEVAMIVPHGATSFYALRWNVKTGQTWSLNAGEWEDYKVSTE